MLEQKHEELLANLTRNLEFFIPEENYWCKGSLIGITGENNFLVEDKNTHMRINEESEANILNLTDKDLRLAQKVDASRHFEFEVSKGKFTSCIIENRKGKFYSISIFKHNSDLNHHEKVVKIAKLAREENIRQVECIYFDDETFQEVLENIIIDLPREIATNWENNSLSENGYSEFIKSIKNEFSEISDYIYFTTYRGIEDNKSHLRVLAPKSYDSSIKLMLEIAIENEMKLLNFEKDKHLNLQKLKNVEKEIAKVKKHYLYKELVGLIIGAKGANINRLKQVYKVNITIQSDIPGDSALITISGDDENNVEKCLNEVKLVKYSYEVKQGQEGRVKSLLQDCQNKYNLVRLNVSKEKYTDNKRGTYIIPYLNLIGSENNIEAAFNELSQYLITY